VNRPWKNRDADPTRLVWRNCGTPADSFKKIRHRNRKMFIPHLYLEPRRGWPRHNLAKIFDSHKTGMIALPCGEKNYNNILSRFHRTQRTDRRTDNVHSAQDSTLAASHQPTSELTQPKGITQIERGTCWWKLILKRVVLIVRSWTVCPRLHNEYWFCLIWYKEWFGLLVLNRPCSVSRPGQLLHCMDAIGELLAMCFAEQSIYPLDVQLSQMSKPSW